MESPFGASLLFGFSPLQFSESKKKHGVEQVRSTDGRRNGAQLDTMSVHHIDVYCERVSISCFIVSDATNASVDRPRFVW